MISAVVVSYNALEHLPRCLSSLALPAGEEVEVVVVDNASTDATARELPRLFPRARFEALGENLGFAAASNRGAALAKGELLLFLNPDAWLAEGSLASLAARLRSEPRWGLAAPRLAYPDGQPQTSWAPQVSVAGEAVQKLRNRLEGRAWSHGRLLRFLLGPVWFTGACLLVRREAFEAVRGFDEGYFLYFEDADFCQRLRRAGWRLGEEPRALAFHARGGTGAPALRAAYRASQAVYYARHRPPWEGRVAAWRASREG
ncbi:MAG: glycosyltransferase family 2 protein [Thermoanaerobaculia bacterium]